MAVAEGLLTAIATPFREDGGVPPMILSSTKAVRRKAGSVPKGRRCAGKPAVCRRAGSVPESRQCA